MDVKPSIFKLHPSAQEMLFSHYRLLRRVFNDVLGLFEIDYLAITIINSKSEILFFSSQPSIEYNLIEKDLWQLDPSYHGVFLNQEKPQTWEMLYPQNKKNQLRYYKQEAHNYSTGLTIPSRFEEKRVVYSFALTSLEESIQKHFHQNALRLTQIGQFCLQNIMGHIPMWDIEHCRKRESSYLKLVINNEVNHVEAN